jgi:hypothetical protein
MVRLRTGEEAHNGTFVPKLHIRWHLHHKGESYDVAGEGRNARGIPASFYGSE